ncbi:MAG: hypothetical protein AB1798_21160 [Spirochaetota bacterium]
MSVTMYHYRLLYAPSGFSPLFIGEMSVTNADSYCCRADLESFSPLFIGEMSVTDRETLLIMPINIEFISIAGIMGSG